MDRDSLYLAFGGFLLLADEMPIISADAGLS